MKKLSGRGDRWELLVEGVVAGEAQDVGDPARNAAVEALYGQRDLLRAQGTAAGIRYVSDEREPNIPKGNGPVVHDEDWFEGNLFGAFAADPSRYVEGWEQAALS